MKKRNKIIIIIAIIIIVLIVIGILIFRNKANNQNNESNENNITQEQITDKNDANIINQIKSQINATADTDMYQVEDEYDGRHTIQIKPSIQFNTVLAGILKQNIPAEDEIDSLLENKPSRNGIWISNKSREKFIKILKDNNIYNYDIDNDGYLYRKEENDTENSKKLNNTINSDRLYIIDISGSCYIRDDLSGEIVEYPFERMDPYQVLEIYTYENSTILEITENSKQKVTNQEILETILLYME